jgi:sulfur transfer protein SufE
MSQSLSDIISTFQSVDEEMRTELLLDYARKLPSVPRRLQQRRDAGLDRVPECMTPVFLWCEPDAQDASRIRLYIDVAEEAPTVAGILSILVHALDGSTKDQIAGIPHDLVNQLGLQNVIRMNRLVGLSAILGRITRLAEDPQPIHPAQ